jgi:integrase
VQFGKEPLMGRRGHNEGSISKRKDGRWEGRISLGYEGGARKRKVFYGKTRRDVQQQLTKALRDHQQGLPVAPERQTVATFLTTWLETAAKPKLRPRTYDSYRQTITKHLIPALGRTILQKLSPQQVQRYLNEKLATGLSARTVQYHHAILRSALNQAVKWDLVPRNVAKLVDVPRAEQHDFRYFTTEEARRFLRVVRTERLEALFTVAVSLGLRQGEALGLRWEDVDLEHGSLRVRMQLQRIDGKLTLVATKTAKSRRTIPLPGFALDAMRRHRTKQLEERLAAGEQWQEHGLVFTTTIGTPIDARNLNRWFQQILTRAELPRIRFHDLRHTAATLLLVQGLSPRVIMETLGHSQISLTMNTYAHMMPAMQREAADQMHELLAGVEHVT